MKISVFAGILLFLCLVAHAGNSSAQSKSINVTGRVVDSLSGDPVAYSTVAVMNGDMKPVSVAAADMKGRFSLEVKAAGSYKLSVSYIGYSTHTDDIELRAENSKVDLGSIEIAPGATAIDEVSVVVSKPLVTVDPDKMTYSVEADPEAEYNTLAEILRKVPQLSVDAEGNVKLNGQSDYKVLVNGKSSSLMSKNFKDVIKSMPANSIKDIEVITNPSTKYEAEGVGGIINIITNRRTIDGYTGRVSLGAGSFENYTGSAYVSAQIGKFSFSTSYYYNQSNQPESTYDYETLRYGANPTKEIMLGKINNDYKGHNLSVEASYEIDTFNLITLSAWGNMASSDFEMLFDGTVFDPSDVVLKRYLRSDYRESSYTSISGSLDYQRTFMKPQKSFTVSYRLEQFPQKNYQTNTVNGITNYPSEKRMSDNRAVGGEHTFQVDYYDPLSAKHQIEAGVKYILRLNTSDTEATIWDGDVWIPDNSNMNDLDYTQHIVGLYGGYLFKHDKFTAKAGFRAEGAINRGVVKTADGNIDFDNNTFNVVPYANLSYMLKPSQTLAFSYTQRLQRPGIWHLNPYVDRVNYPGQLMYGNPNLDAAVSNSFSLNYSLFSSSWNLYLSAGASLGNNSIMTYTKNSGDILEMSYYNMGREQRYNFNASYNYRHKAIFNIYVGAYVNYSIMEGDVSKVPGGGDIPALRNEGFGFGANAGGSASLWKNARLSVNYGIFSSSITLQGRGSTYQYSSVGLTQRFFKEKLDVSVWVSNPFNKYHINRNESESAGSFKTVSDFRYRSRTITFSAGFLFGKMNVNVKKVGRGIRNDDLMGGGGGQGGGK